MSTPTDKPPFRSFLRQRVAAGLPVFFDGGMGTMIQKAGAVGYKLPEDLNFYRPDIILGIHRQYLEAGCHILTANSFGANPVKLAGEGAAHTAEAYIAEAVRLQKQAIAEAEARGIPGPHYASWDTGQIGMLLEPMGTLTFDEAYEGYRAAAVAAEEAGAEVAIIETMSDLYEVKAAVLAVQENTSLPVVADMTFQSNLRTLTGADVLTCVTYLEALHVDVLGFNCGGSLEEDAELARQYLACAHIPVCIEPNAGLPEVVDGHDVFRVEPEEFAAAQAANRALGAVLLGGCCGTTPAHIRAMVEAVGALPAAGAVPHHARWHDSYVCSYNKAQQAGGAAGPVLIGERINPTGKKKCKEALLAGDMDYVLGEAESQIAQGAHLLDVNVGLPGIDEAAVMVRAVRAIQSTFNVPLQLDSSEPAVLERALRYYNGKALVNSVNGKQAVMDAVFPLIRRYGGAVVALCIDEDGIAPTAEGRVAVARAIIAEAAKYGIPVRDIFIDTLTLTVSSEQKTALETIRAIRMLKEEYGAQGVQFVLGVSNISFGLPRRDIMNSRFFMLALEAGLTGCIANPASAAMMDTFRAYRSLACFDENSLDYIQMYSGTLDPATAKGRDAIVAQAAAAGALPPQARDAVLARAIASGSLPPAATEALLRRAVQDGTIGISINTGAGGTTLAARAAPPPADPAESGGTATAPGENAAGGSPADGAGAPPPGSAGTAAPPAPQEQELISIIERGFKDKAAAATEALLRSAAPVDVIDRCIVPALDSVGKDFEAGRKFLPQLLLSADTVANSFGKIKEVLAASGTKEESKGTIAIATVYGDIHDIGKNIVRAMLENYGYTVIDLGKNVPPETIVQTVLDNGIRLVGLSALMTTTVANMEKTIQDLRAALAMRGRTCKIMVGGAVLTADYAEKIGADYYAKDAMASVAVAKEVFGV